MVCSTNRKNRVLRVPDLSLPVSTETVSDNVCVSVHFLHVGETLAF
jgi:hypothetical protein